MAIFRSQRDIMSFRDANLIVIETSRTAIRAGLGIYELLKTPSVVRFDPCNVLSIDFFKRKYPPV